MVVGLRLKLSWRAKYLGLVALIVLMMVAPLIAVMVTRTQLGLTFENDGLAKAEVAAGRLLQGEQIYGINWQGTEVQGYSQIGNGREVRHFNHLPMTVLAAVPIRLLTGALGLAFDYRMLLLLLVLAGIAAVSWLPAPFNVRFMVGCALFISPALPVMTITGHDDVAYVVMLMSGLTLMARGRQGLACLAFGLSAAFKPFGALAIPLVLMVMWRDWQRRPAFPKRETAAIAAALVLPSVLSITPFLLWNAGAFWRDVVLFTNGGIADAFPISGIGLGGILVAFGLLRANGAFPFGVLQLGGVGIVYRQAWQRLRPGPTMAWFMGWYAAVFFTFAFFARFFVDNYVAAVMSLALCILPLSNLPLRARADDAIEGDAARLVDAA